ncbi:ea4b001e-6d9f-432d-9a22-0313b30fdd3f [Thermothielavioides terrestris]|uniref:peptidylprolyl isomerase n=1 Tax=Thermothielavioides terrestris TaxID=2587410 RepID=A0A3S4F341_9PEZI|nr:ea4b001e-6d9f-432d-9a22-0313b30fdd3f [Thermothielavioides terrestris]
MPRLLQRARRPEAAPGRSADEDVPLELPPYEPPSYPMDAKIKQKLASLYSNREIDSSRRQYEKHLNKSTAFLFESVGSINDILFARKRSLSHMAEKRRARGDEKNEAEVSLEEYVAQLDAAITELTDSCEEATRWLIDSRAELEDQQAVLEKVMEGLNAQQARPEPKPQEPRTRASRRRVVGSDDDDDDDGGASGDAAGEEGDDVVDGAEAAADVPPLVGVKELLNAARKAKRDEYEALSAYQRYAVHNDYIAFKKNWHDALHSEDQVPLPDPSTWFDDQGRPTKGVPPDAHEDDDLVVEREIIDLKCPLSLQMFKEPYSNHQCKHTFEKAAIMEFIRSSGGVAKCPVCSKDLRIKDLYLDEVVLRKVKRAEQAARRGEADTSDIEPEEEDVDSSVVIGPSTQLKKERDRSRRRMEEIDDD